MLNIILSSDLNRSEFKLLDNLFTDKKLHDLYMMHSAWIKIFKILAFAELLMKFLLLSQGLSLFCDIVSSMIDISKQIKTEINTKK